jgi:hypothetical protein
MKVRVTTSRQWKVAARCRTRNLRRRPRLPVQNNPVRLIGDLRLAIATLADGRVAFAEIFL